MQRRTWLARAMSAVGTVVWAVQAGRARADSQQPTLKETLRSALKCRRPEEFAFVDLVVAKVEQGQLPRPLVLNMMQWARRRREDLPFPYFQEGLRRRAAELGVTLPPLTPVVP
jgi:hypothetical protein